MPSRTLVAAALAVFALLGAACGAGGETGAGSAAPPPEEKAKEVQAARVLARSAPRPLGAVYAQANELLPGGAPAFEGRLRGLRGYPVVVNKWASWCGPCRAELPYFRRQALERGEKVAFLGANTNDSDGPARSFLAELPLPFPSYSDQNGDIAQVFNGNVAFPSTAFYARDGRLATVKQGVYSSERQLAGDIDRYAR